MPDAGKVRRSLVTLPVIAVLLSLLYLAAPLFSGGRHQPFDVEAFGKIPVQSGGRIKPIDTVARTSLLVLSGKQTLSVPSQKSKTAMAWLLDVLFAPEKADQYAVFRIDEPDVLGLLNIQQTDQTRFSFAALAPHLQEIERQAVMADRVDSAQRSLFQNAIINLQNRLALYQRLENTLQTARAPGMLRTFLALREAVKGSSPDAEPPAELSPELKQEMVSFLDQCRLIGRLSEFRPIALPEAAHDENAWRTLGDAVIESMTRRGVHGPGVMSFFELGAYYRQGDAAAFNQALQEHHKSLAATVPQDVSRAAYEALFNKFAPFYQSMVIYVVALLLSFLYWLLQRPALNKAALALVVVAFAVHTAGLISRIVLQGRPPVTNLYSSAVFVGWGAVLFGIILEMVHRRGIGQIVSAFIGFVTLIIAHHLSLQGDTMEMMRAVLDSNFWLTTHVVAITIGYSSTFLCGAVGIMYLVRRAFSRQWNADSAAALHRMVYGLLCFSAFFTFVGTVLGGIWADQSWGRFWGWDPKENGALLIVLWILLILHARAGWLVSEKSVMALAVFGNVVTAIAWFGVNMLNIGLHSYGYMDQAFTWLVVFSISQLAIMALAWLPARVERTPA